MSLRRVLIVGDEDGARRVRESLAEVAALPPGEVDHTQSPEDALRRLATGAYDLCIVDGRVAGPHAAALLREARARGIDVPAVQLGGRASASPNPRFSTVLNEAERRRHRAEDALLRSEERYRTLFDAVPVGLYRTTSDRRFANANPAMAQMLGFASVETLIGSDALEIYVDPDVRAEFTRRLEREGMVQGFEAQLRRQDGSVLWSLDSARATLDDAGRILHIEGTVQDITDRKQAELRLRESEAEYRLLFDTNPHPMWVIDLQTLRFLAANAAAVSAYGFSREEFLTLTVADIRLPEDLPQMHASARAFAAAGEGIFSVGEVRHRKKDGTVFDVHVTSSRLTFAGRPASLAMAIDITERKRAAAALEKLEGQLRQSQKMEAIGQLAGGVAHDFNNLLGVIIGYSELILRDLTAGSPSARRMAEVRTAADRAATLTRQLLAFSRRQVLQPRILDLNAVVVEAEAMLARVISENIEVVTVLAPNLGRVRADPGQLHQVVLNFAVNARDAMPDGGRLTLETRNVDLASAAADRHPTLAPGRYVALVVSDTGAGMPPEVLEHMFEPFFTTKEQGHGTGLGLATVYGVVTQSGGHVEVESALGRGTTFKVYLPVAEAEQDPVVPPAAGPRASETVLLIEDAEPLREMVQEILEADGFRVLAAEAGERALEVAASHQGAIALVITDVVMPGISGPAAAERLKLLRPDIRVLFMSGYTDEAIGRHGELDRDTHFIQKPFSAEALLRKVRETLA